MKRIVMALAAFAALSAAGANAQTASRDQFLIGNWTCQVEGADIEFDEVTTRFDPGGPMELRFHATISEVALAFTLFGTWTYDTPGDRFSQTISNARISDIVVSGEPMTRAQYPGGEAAVQGIEQEFMDIYASSPLTFTTVTATELLITDIEGDTIDCGR